MDQSTPPLAGRKPVQPDEQTLPLHGEDLTVTRRRVTRATVRVETVTNARTHAIDEALVHERVEVERVPVGRIVAAIPPIREQGDVTILSVVEEIIVVERRLLLKEEVHVRRVRIHDRHRETIALREQDAVITRTAIPAGERAGPESRGTQ